MGASLSVFTRCCSISGIYKSLDTQVLLCSASSLAIGKALDVSGAAQSIAHTALSFGNGSSLMLLVCTYFMASLLTELITNTAAAVLMFPIVMAAAETLGVDVKPFIIALMMAASASFATPIGYQTNLMVYGPGGYKFRDYVVFGGLLNVTVGIATVAIIPLLWPELNG